MLSIIYHKNLMVKNHISILLNRIIINFINDYISYIYNIFY